MHGWEWVWGTVDDTSESRDVGKRKWRWQPTSYLLFPIIPYSLCFSFVLRNFCCCEEKEVDGRSTYPDDIMTWIRPSDHRWKVARPKLSSEGNYRLQYITNDANIYRIQDRILYRTKHTSSSSYDPFAAQSTKDTHHENSLSASRDSFLNLRFGS